MDRCIICKNIRRSLLLLKCHHDVCIQCSANHYFINCKNNILNNRSRKNHYYCEICEQQTQMGISMINQLKDQFLNNLNFEERQRTNRIQNVRENENNQAKSATINYFGNFSNSCTKNGQNNFGKKKKTLNKQGDDYQFSMMKNIQIKSGKEKNRIKNQLKSKGHPNDKISEKNKFPQPQKNEYQLINTHQKNQQKQFQDRTSSQKCLYKRQKPNHQLKNNKKCRCQSCHRKSKYQLFRKGKFVISCDSQIAYNFMLKDKRIKSQKAIESRGMHRSSQKGIAAIKKQRSSKLKTNLQKQQRPIASIANKQQLKNNNRRISERNQRLISCKSEDTLQKRVSHNLKEEIRLLRKQRDGVDPREQQLWQIESKSTKKFDESHFNKNNLESKGKIFEFDCQQKKLKDFEKIKQKYAQGKSSSKLNTIKDNPVKYYCQIHKKEKIIFFCQKCSQLSCGECIESFHQGHDIYPFKKSVKHLKKSLTGRLNILVDLINEQYKNESKLKQCLEQINLESGKQKEMIKTSFENLMTSIDKKYKQLLKEIQDKSMLIRNQYNEKIAKSIKNNQQMNKIKDTIVTIVQQYQFNSNNKYQDAFEENCASIENLDKLSKHGFSRNKEESEICSIKNIIHIIEEFENFLNKPNQLFSLNNKQSLRSENSSLKLSQSSNLLDDLTDKQINQIPLRDAAPVKSINTNSPKQQKLKRTIILTSGCLNVPKKIKLFDCALIAESLIEMKDIIKSMRLSCVQYELKAMIMNT